MERHRIRVAIGLDKDDEPNLLWFVELEPESWVGVVHLNFDHDSIHTLLDQEKSEQAWNLRMHTRGFSIFHGIQDWQELPFAFEQDRGES